MVSATVVQDPAGDTSTETDNYTYTYDPNQADALTGVTDAATLSGPNLFLSFSRSCGYAYDGAGNLTGTSMGSPNALNQYSNLAYNARGDVTDNGTYTITWDAMDRPIVITPKNVAVGSFQVKLGYDSQDRWLWKDVYQWNGSAWVYAYSREAVWDGSNLAAELDASGNMLVQYPWGANAQLAAITDYTQSTPHTYVPVIDASGNTAMLVDPLAGTVVASYSFDSYGTLLGATGPEAGLCPFLGKGLYVHAELPGLMFAEHRLTDGKIWLSRDPSGESSDPNVNQLYNGDPINGADPTGLKVTMNSDITDFLRKNGVTGFHVDHQYGKFTFYGSTNFNPTDIQAEILGEMIASKRDFQPEDGSIDDLMLNVSTRIAVVKAAATATVTCGTPVKINTDLWIGPVTSRGSPERALNDMWDPNSQPYQMGCVGATQDTELRGISQKINIDALHTPGRNVEIGKFLKVWTNNRAPAQDGYADEVRNLDVFIPGDTAYIANLDPRTKHGLLT